MNESEKKFNATLDSLSTENRKLRSAQFKVDSQLVAVKMLMLELVDYMGGQIEKLVADAKAALVASKRAANAARSANPKSLLEATEAAETAAAATLERAVEVSGYLRGIVADPAFPV